MEKKINLKGKVSPGIVNVGGVMRQFDKAEFSTKNRDYIPDKKNIGKTLADFFDSLPKKIDIWAEIFIAMEVSGRKSKNTLKAYINSLNEFIKFYTEYKNTNDIDLWIAQDSNRYFQYLTEIGKSTGTIELRYNTLKKFVKWMMSIKNDLFKLGDPLEGIKTPAKESQKPKGLSNKQIKKIIDVIINKMRKYYIAPDFKIPIGEIKISRPKRNYAIVYLMLNTGLRRQEIVDIDIEQFKGKYLKNVKCKGNQYRDVLLTNNTSDILNDYIDIERKIDEKYIPESKALFLPAMTRKNKNRSGRLSTSMINKMIKKISKEANKTLKEDEQIPGNGNPHMFRHTHAIRLIDSGRDLSYVARRLGHRSINTTSKYTVPSEETESGYIEEAESGK